MTRRWMGWSLAAIVACVGVITAVEAATKPRATVKASAKKSTKARVSAKKAPARKIVVAAKPPAPLPPPPIAIPLGGNTLGAHAALYAAYANDVDNLAVRSVLSGNALTVSTEKIARHLNSERLALGIVAYGAAYAATSDTFVAEARKAAAYFGRDAFIAMLKSQYSYARALPGGEEAAALAARAVLADAAKIQSEGDDFKQAAYDWQALAWGKQSTADAAARNLALRALVPPPPEPDIALRLSSLPAASITPEARQMRLAELATTSRIANETGRTSITLAEPIRTWSPTDRMVAVAALMAIGAPVDKQSDTETIMRDPRLVSCVNSARLNMQMCNAATKQPYERSFCLAEHPLGEIAKCMAKVVR
ncbi:MAG: hypothetical protein RLZZ157_228 [Pseudomonadota bacterium]